MKRVVLLFFSVVFLKNKLISEIQDKNNNKFIDTNYTSRLLIVKYSCKKQKSNFLNFPCSFISLSRQKYFEY